MDTSTKRNQFVTKVTRRLATNCAPLPRELLATANPPARFFGPWIASCQSKSEIGASHSMVSQIGGGSSSARSSASTFECAPQP